MIPVLCALARYPIYPIVTVRLSEWICGLVERSRIAFRYAAMQIRSITIQRFRGIEHLQFEPSARTVILGPNNARKSTVLEALDLLLHHGIGRPLALQRERIERVRGTM